VLWLIKIYGLPIIFGWPKIVDFLSRLYFDHPMHLRLAVVTVMAVCLLVIIFRLVVYTAERVQKRVHSRRLAAKRG
jgi:hypothetical protein